jgi:hypothetical protein
MGDIAISLSASNVVLISAIPAIYSFLGALLTRLRGFSPVALASGWVGVEVAFKALGLNHGLLLPSGSYGPILQAVSDFLGCGIIAFLVLLSNALLVFIVGAIAFRCSSSALQDCCTGSAQLKASYSIHHVSSSQVRLPQQRAPPPAPVLTMQET